MAAKNLNALAGAASALVMLGLISGCDQAATLRLAGDVPANRTVLEGVSRVHPGEATSLGSMTVCLTKPGRATITDVKPLNPVGRIIVQAYAVRPSPFMQSPPGQALGDGTGPLSRFGFPAAHVVDIACGSRKGAAYELAVQVMKPTNRDVGAAGWVVSYTSGGEAGKLTVPLAVKLCSEQSADSARCRNLDHHFLADG